jgi:hypothetical protein
LSTTKRFGIADAVPAKKHKQRKDLAMKKLVSLLKSYLTKSSPAVVTPTFKTEQFEKVKKSLLEQTAKDSCCGGKQCKCSGSTPTPAPTAKKKPAVKKNTSPKAE